MKKTLVTLAAGLLLVGSVHAEISHVYTPSGVTTINQIGGSTFISGPTGSVTCTTIGSTTFCN